MSNVHAAPVSCDKTEESSVWGFSAAFSCLAALSAKAPGSQFWELSLFSLWASNTTSQADGPDYEPCSQTTVINMCHSAKMKAKQNAVHARETNFLIPAHKQQHNHKHKYWSSMVHFCKIQIQPRVHPIGLFHYFLMCFANSMTVLIQPSDTSLITSTSSSFHCNNPSLS